ncbi:MAG: hypothetical protein HGA66_08955, partial [Holophaga sp.]|nr:hypothetical protein [Holophaga sp.]
MATWAGTILAGADLRRALLDKAVMARASLAGAAMYESDAGGAIDLDLTGARPHPFFEPAPGEAAGTVTFLEVPGYAVRGSRRQHLVPAPDGSVYYLERGGALLNFTVNGFWIPVGLPPGLHGDLHWAVADGENNLWLSTDIAIAHANLEGVSLESGTGEHVYRTLPASEVGSVLSVTAGPGAQLWVCGQGEPAGIASYLLSPRLRNGKVPDYTQATYRSPAQDAAGALPLAPEVFLTLSPSAGKLFLMDPDQTQVRILTKRKGRPGQATPRAMALQGRNVWVTLPNHDRIMLIRLAEKRGQELMRAELVPIDLPEGSQPWGIALGPDGALWFTAKGSGRIGRIDPEKGLAVETFPLPEGCRPTDIVAGARDGRMYFLQEATGRIGAIRAHLPARIDPEAKANPAAVPEP